MDLSLLGFRGLREVYNVHPAFVHFPVALLPSALLLYVLGVLLKRPALNAAGRACLYLATAGAAAAVTTGLLAEDSFPHNETIHHMMETHESLAITVLAMACALSVWSFLQQDHRPRAAWAFLAFLGLANLVVLQAADLGGRMVFVEGAAVKPAVSAIVGDEPKGPKAASAEQPEQEQRAGHHHHHH